MSYKIAKTNGVVLTNIDDGTLDNTTSSLTIVGKNYIGYGKFLNENFLHLLENFANDVSPTKPTQGQIWFDNYEMVLKVYTGTNWKTLSSLQSGSVTPVAPTVGDIWWDITSKQLKVWAGTEWLVIGPTYTSSETSGALVETIADINAILHSVVKIYVTGQVINIISRDAEFIPATPIPGFATIKPGMNLINDIIVANSQYTGTASNSELLNGVSASQLVRNDIDILTTHTLTVRNNLGVTIGGGDEFNIKLDSHNVQLRNNNDNAKLEFHVKNNGVDKNIFVLDGQDNTSTINAPLNITGYASAYTANIAENSNVVATTAYVRSVTDYMASLTGTMAGQNANAVSITGGTISNVDGYTAVPGNNTTKLATTAFVQQEIVSSIDAIPKGLGVNQTWQDLLTTRSPGAYITNSTGRPIMVAITIQNDYAGKSTLTVGNVVVAASSVELTGVTSGMLQETMTAIVPNLTTYRVDVTSQSPIPLPSILRWAELR